MFQGLDDSGVCWKRQWLFLVCRKRQWLFFSLTFLNLSPHILWWRESRFFCCWDKWWHGLLLWLLLCDVWSQERICDVVSPRSPSLSLGRRRWANGIESALSSFCPFLPFSSFTRQSSPPPLILLCLSDTRWTWVPQEGFGLVWLVIVVKTQCKIYHFYHCKRYSLWH